MTGSGNEKGTLDTRAICYGLVRAGGAIGFAVGVGATLYVSRTRLGVALDHTAAFAGMTRQQIVVVVIAVVAGMTGALFGQGFGASISVSNDRTSQSLDALWHFSANTVMMWIPTVWLLFGLVMGREAVKEYWQTHSVEEMMFLSLVLPLAAGLIITLLLWFSVEVVPRVAGVPQAFVLTNVSPFIVCGGCGAYAASELGLAPAYGLPLALLAILIVPASLASMRKDKNRRLGG
jgi:hypothetical protein